MLNYRRTYSQRRQHQAARKIQQFMRQSKNKLQRERAEKERQSAPLGYQDALQRSHSRAANLQLITAQNQCSEETSMAAEESISTDLHFWSDLL